MGNGAPARHGKPAHPCMRPFFLEICACQRAHFSAGAAEAQRAVAAPIDAGSADGRPGRFLTDDDTSGRALRLVRSGAAGFAAAALPDFRGPGRRGPAGAPPCSQGPGRLSMASRLFDQQTDQIVHRRTVDISAAAHARGGQAPWASSPFSEAMEEGFVQDIINVAPHWIWAGARDFEVDLDATWPLAPPAEALIPLAKKGPRSWGRRIPAAGDNATDGRQAAASPIQPAASDVQSIQPFVSTDSRRLFNLWGEAFSGGCDELRAPVRLYPDGESVWKPDVLYVGRGVVVAGRRFEASTRGNEFEVTTCGQGAANRHYAGAMLADALRRALLPALSGRSLARHCVRREACRADALIDLFMSQVARASSAAHSGPPAAGALPLRGPRPPAPPAEEGRVVAVTGPAHPGKPLTLSRASGGNFST